MTEARRVWWVVVAMLAGGFLGTGCASCKPGKSRETTQYPITVKLVESLKDASMEVDLIGATPDLFPRLLDYNIGDYWKENDPLKSEVDRVHLDFRDGTTLSRALAKTDPIWTKWKAKGVTHVFVFSNLAGVPPDRRGKLDPRRGIISLNKCKWVAGTAELTVLVQRSGPVVENKVREGWESFD